MAILPLSSFVIKTWRSGTSFLSLSVSEGALVVQLCRSDEAAAATIEHLEGVNEVFFAVCVLHVDIVKHSDINHSDHGNSASSSVPVGHHVVHYELLSSFLMLHCSTLRRLKENRRPFGRRHLHHLKHLLHVHVCVQHCVARDPGH